MEKTEILSEAEDRLSSSNIVSVNLCTLNRHMSISFFLRSSANHNLLIEVSL